MDFKNLVLAVKSNLFTYFLQSVYCTDQSSLVSFFTNKIEFAHPKRAHIFSIVVIWLVPIQVSTKLLLIQIKLGYQGIQLAQTGSCNFFGKENSLTFSSQNNEAKLPDLKKGEKASQFRIQIICWIRNLHLAFNSNYRSKHCTVYTF